LTSESFLVRACYVFVLIFYRPWILPIWKWWGR